MKKIILVMGIVFVGAVFTIGLKAEGIREGKWEFTMVTKMEGMGDEYAKAMKEMEDMPADQKAMMQQMMGKMGVNMDANSQGITTTVTKCVSDQDPVPSMNNGDEDCKESHSTESNTIKFETDCKGNKSSGHVTYNGDSMEGKIKSHQKAGGKETNATIEVNGKYLGPCS